jgi:hypothetical protein
MRWVLRQHSAILEIRKLDHGRDPVDRDAWWDRPHVPRAAENLRAGAAFVWSRVHEVVLNQ